MIVPDVSGVVLGASKTGLVIGYRLVDLAGNIIVPFTTTGVSETSVPGDYTVLNGIDIENNFSGRIVWGTSGTDLAEEWVFLAPICAVTDVGVTPTPTAPTTVAAATTINYRVNGALVPYTTVQTLVSQGQLAGSQVTDLS